MNEHQDVSLPWFGFTHHVRGNVTENQYQMIRVAIFILSMIKHVNVSNTMQVLC